MTGFGNMPTLSYDFTVQGQTLSDLLVNINEEGAALLGEKDIRIDSFNVVKASGSTGSFYRAHVTILATIHPTDAEEPSPS